MELTKEELEELNNLYTDAIKSQKGYIILTTSKDLNTSSSKEMNVRTS